jgi:nucleotide-binding universal stress UspA family protein
MYRKILIPLDGSCLSEAALPHAKALAEAFGAEIVLLSVPIYPVFDPVAIDPALLESMYDGIRSQAMKYLLRMSAPLKQTGLNVTIELRDGPVADTILGYAEQVHADLIAMSTHGRGGMTRWLLGSVADRVVRGGQVPVLLIRPSPAAERASRTANESHTQPAV